MEAERDLTDRVEARVFDGFPWWDSGDVLTQITPTRFRYIACAVGDLRGRSVLDVGCGGGLLAEPIAAAGATVTGVDVSLAALDVARGHASGSGLEIGYRHAAVEKLPFGDETFDVAVAFDVLDHVHDLKQTLGEIARVLRPGGKIVYDTMNRTLVSRLVVIWIGENIWRGGPPKGTHHWQKFVRPDELVGLMAESGLQNVETRGFAPIGVDAGLRLRMGLSCLKGISYVGYAVKGRTSSRP